jgi:Sec-independent protein secretion pathway component TatC
MDGSVSGLNDPTIIASGLELAKDWWGVDNQGLYWIMYNFYALLCLRIAFILMCALYLALPTVVYEPQAPLRFIKKKNGPI